MVNTIKPLYSGHCLDLEICPLETNFYYITFLVKFDTRIKRFVHHTQLSNMAVSLSLHNPIQINHLGKYIYCFIDSRASL